MHYELKIEDRRAKRVFENVSADWGAGMHVCKSTAWVIFHVSPCKILWYDSADFMSKYVLRKHQGNYRKRKHGSI